MQFHASGTCSDKHHTTRQSNILLFHAQNIYPEALGPRLDAVCLQMAYIFGWSQATGSVEASDLAPLRSHPK